MSEPVLNNVADVFQSVNRSNLFDLEDSILESDNSLVETYKSEHKSTTQVNVFFGPIWIKEAVGIEIVENTTDTPVYHYDSPYFSDIIDGKFNITGNLYVYETITSELMATIAKYKVLLKEERIDDARIKDIVAQRNNLFRAGITEQLITRLGAEGAIQAADNALNSINGELITGKDWTIPKLIIVSGSITDKQPLVDVFEYIKFNKTSKAIMADGATQIRVYSFIGKKRPIRDSPSNLPPKKYVLDMEETIQDYTNRVLNRVKDNIRVEINANTLPVPFSANNISFTGTLPDTISSWGPEFCPAAIRVTQFGAPEEINEPVNVHLVRNELVNGTTVTSGNSDVQDAIKAGARVVTIPIVKSIKSSLSRVWKEIYPDLDFLMYNLDFIGRTVPTSKTLSFSWLVPPPALPKSNKYIYREEDRHRVSGSVLTSAHYSMTFYDSINRKSSGTFVDERAPVRGLSYVPMPSLKIPETEDVTEDLPPFISYRPVHISRIWRAIDKGSQIMNALRSKTQRLGTEVNDYDGIYDYEKWYKYELGGLTLTSFLDHIGFIDSENDTTEDVTSGLIGNIDKLNMYKDELTDFPETSGINNLCVQVYAIGVQSSTEVIDGIPILGALFGLLKDIFTGLVNQVSSWLFDNQVERDDAKKLLHKGICIPNAIKYIWSVTKEETSRYLNIGVTWNKEAVSELINKNTYPTILVRVFSQAPQIVVDPENSADKLQQVQATSEFVSPATHVPSAMADIDVVVRTDRQYINYPQRPPWSWPADALSKIEPWLAEDDGMITNWANTMETTSTMQRFKKKLATGVAPLGQASVEIIESVVFKYTLSALQATIDTTDQAYNIFTHLPVVEQALDLVNSTVGLDLEGLFRDSEILAGDRMKMKNISVYTNGERYVVLLSTLSSKIADNIGQAIRDASIVDLLDTNPRTVNIDTLGSRRNSNDNILNEQVTKFVSSEFRKVFTEEDGWSVNNFPGSALNALGIDATIEESFFNEGDTAGTDQHEIIILTRKAIKPSPFLVDLASKEIEFEDNPEDPNVLLKGVKL